MPRRAVMVSGVVQGVGFRPFVYELAARHQLTGFVRNCVGTVEIEVEGAEASLDEFVEELRTGPPSLAVIDRLAIWARAPLGSREFRIETSDNGAEDEIYLSPDVATCEDCRAELFDPGSRRYRYPFINCTNCGPRLTIICGSPYDRRETTMADFPMCDACRREYEDPGDRRFHAEPIACAECGPRLHLKDAAGAKIESADPIAAFVEVIREGGIGALKGLGGYHLVCDARSERAVGKLRHRKHRDEKPFAIMVRDIEAAKAICDVNSNEERMLEQPARPIVLLRRDGSARMSCGDVCEAVAPRNPFLGVMLPYTPVHHLLMASMEGIPLVMTSGNRSDEPIAYRDESVVRQLAGIADVFLTNDRPIRVRCDDSIVRPSGENRIVVRRSRGFAPLPIRLPISCDEPILAVGGQLKNVFGLLQNGRAVLSQHMGDLAHFEAFRQFERDVSHFERVFRVTPRVIAHDLHPDYVSTQYAMRRAIEAGLVQVAVQHHHAHLASCLAENGLEGPAIGVTFDGTGYGIDARSQEATIWGGEFLVGDYREFRRAAHLRNVSMPGGEAAIHEPWRMALSHLRDAHCECERLRKRISDTAYRTVERMLERRFHSPLTSSLGRLFDAAAAIVGVRDRVSYEGQAAMELEWLAEAEPADEVYPIEIEDQATPNMPMVIDTRPIVRGMVNDLMSGTAPARIAGRFHSTIATLVAEVCARIRNSTGIDVVALSGGVFMNGLLTEQVTSRLMGNGFRVYRHRLVPPNDGGLCLGQLAVAAAKIGCGDVTLNGGR